MLGKKMLRLKSEDFFAAEACRCTEYIFPANYIFLLRFLFFLLNSGKTLKEMSWMIVIIFTDRGTNQGVMYCVRYISVGLLRKYLGKVQKFQKNLFLVASEIISKLRLSVIPRSFLIFSRVSRLGILVEKLLFL